MGKYRDIVDQIIRGIREDGAAGGAVGGTTGGMVGPAVAQDGNTSIAYLPGGFSKRKKKKPGVKGVEDTVAEAKSELVHNIYSKLMRVMTNDLRENKQVKKTIVLLNYWLSLFPSSKYLSISSSVAVNLGSYDRSIRDLINRIKNIYSDDIGNLQMLMNAIQNDMPLNAHAPFSEFEYVVAVRVQTEYQGIVMIPEFTVNLAMIPAQSIYIESSDVLDELGSYRTVKVIKDMIFPVGQMFQPSLIRNIKDIIDDLGDKENNRNV